MTKWLSGHGDNSVDYPKNMDNKESSDMLQIFFYHEATGKTHLLRVSDSWQVSRL